MSTSVLGNLTLGYEPIWNARRALAGVRLVVEHHSSSAVDARHLLAALSDLRARKTHVVVLSTSAPVLLSDLLDHNDNPNLWIEVPATLMGDAMLAGRMRKACQRGMTVVWHGAAGQSPGATAADAFNQSLRILSPEQALDALRVSLRQYQDSGLGAASGPPSPVVAGQMYLGLASQALVEHALDRQGVWGVVGWPSEEILHAYRFRQIQPSRSLLDDLVREIDADESLERLEHSLCREPLLTYRFLLYANSAQLGARSEVGSIRQGLMVMGYTKLRAWLMAQWPHSSGDLNLDPIRTTLVLRARIMEQLCDAGAEDDLRHEVFLCGMFSQMDLLLGEPLGAAIHRLPLPGRISSAVVGQSGPYAPWLEVATVLESGNTRLIRQVCQAHKIEPDEVNRALLRALTGT